jgi:hypothetical protein
MEGSETDVGHFFLTERDSLRRREVKFLRNVSGRGGRRKGSPNQPKG